MLFRRSVVTDVQVDVTGLAFELYKIDCKVRGREFNSYGYGTFACSNLFPHWRDEAENFVKRKWNLERANTGFSKIA